MVKKNHSDKPAETQKPNKQPELPHEYVPGEPEAEEEDSNEGTIYDEDPFENPPYETPPSGEGP